MNRETRDKLHDIIFEADTTSGKLFDIILIIAILVSVIIVMLETISGFSAQYSKEILLFEWLFTIIFSVEYILRILVVRKPLSYIFSFYGLIDLLSILPTYLSLFIPGTQSLLIIRSFRLLRVFRVLKLTRYIGEASTLSMALKASQAKITVFLIAVFIIVSIVGTLMYLIEGPESGFTSIPVAVYWAIVTVTTVGFGDVTPESPLGQILASILMFAGYGVIAVPSGIVSVELSKAHTNSGSKSCKYCCRQGHADNAVFCKFCGKIL